MDQMTNKPRVHEPPDATTSLEYSMLYHDYQALLEQAEKMAKAMAKNCQDDGNYDNCSDGNCWRGCVVIKEKDRLLKQWQEFKK